MTPWENFRTRVEVIRELYTKLEQFLEPLDARERDILKLRLGIGEPQTMEEVGEVFNLTGERIRQIEALAISKIRHPDSDIGTSEPREPLSEDMAQLFAPLDQREREVLILRFGLDRGGEPRTLEEVGEAFNLTRERIRQIEARAMSKIRHQNTDTGAKDLLF